MSTNRSAKASRVSIEEIRQAELIEATLRTISALGFERATVRDIARAAGASTGSVHYYFPTKEDLLRAAVADSDDRFRAQVREALADVPGAAAKLERIVDFCFPAEPAEGPDWNVFIDFWQQANRRDDFRAIFEAANVDWLEMLVGIMEEGVRTEELAIEGSVHDEAMGFAAMIDGLALHSRVTNHVDGATARRILRERIRELSGAPSKSMARGKRRSHVDRSV